MDMIGIDLGQSHIGEGHISFGSSSFDPLGFIDGGSPFMEVDTAPLKAMAAQPACELPPFTLTKSSLS